LSTRLTFEASKRLHQPAEFRALKVRGRKQADAYFSLSVLANQRTCARLGLAIATRTLGSSVARNRLKRITRESFRLVQHALPAVDIMVSARTAARSSDAKQLRISLEKHWKIITQRW
jgi:ribonuclease P protein component